MYCAIVYFETDTGIDYNDSNVLCPFCKKDANIFEYTKTIVSVYCSDCGSYFIICPLYMTFGDENLIIRKNKCSCYKDVKQYTTNSDILQFSKKAFIDFPDAKICIAKLAKIIGFSNRYIMRIVPNNFMTQSNINKKLLEHYKKIESILRKKMIGDMGEDAKEDIDASLKQYGFMYRRCNSKLDCVKCKHKIVNNVRNDYHIFHNTPFKFKYLNNFKFISYKMNTYNLSRDPFLENISLDNCYLLICKDSEGKLFKCLQWGD